MTDSPKIYFVRGGWDPKMSEAYLAREHHDCYEVHNGDGSQVYNIFKRRLEVSRTKALTDRTKAVALLLHHLQEAKAQSERRIARIDAAIKEIMDKEGL